MREALHINTSLTALGKVIMALDPTSENTHIPYRDSKLTRILQNTLSGNSFTTLMATLNPHPSYFEECLSTLQFANRCRNVHNHPRVNYLGESEDKDKKIKRLLEEITALRTRLHLYEAREGGAGRGGAIEAPSFTPSKLISVLQTLGLNAALGSNGEMIFNGKVVTAETLGLEEVFSAAASNNGHSGLGGRGGEYARAQMREIQKENTEYKGRNRTLRDLVEKLELENQKLKDEVSIYRTTIHASQGEYKVMAAQYERTLEVEKERQKKEEERKLKELMEHNQYLLSSQHSSVLYKKETEMRMMLSSRLLSNEKVRKEKDDAEDGMNATLQHAHLQARFSMLEKESQALISQEREERCRDHEESKTRIRSIEDEVVNLYLYVASLEACLTKISSALSIKRVLAPSPADTLKTKSDAKEDVFTLTHRLVASYLRHRRGYHRSPIHILRLETAAVRPSSATTVPRTFLEPSANESRPQSAMSTWNSKIISKNSIGGEKVKKAQEGAASLELAHIGIFAEKSRLELFEQHVLNLHRKVLLS